MARRRFEQAVQVTGGGGKQRKMESDTLAILREIDPRLLTDMVRQDQQNTSFEILDWSVEAISHEKIIATTGGLFRFSGLGRARLETRPWALVLKIVNKPPDLGLNPHEWAYWKREMLAFESGML